MLKNTLIFLAGAATWTVVSTALVAVLVKVDPDFIQRTDSFYKGL